jgi:multiple sugar transport system substrate-binding protein
MLAVSLLAGCGGGAASGGDKNDAGGKGAEQPAAGKSGEPVEVVFYAQNGMAPAEFDNRYGNSLRAKFPQYTIKYIQNTGKGTDVPGMLATGTHYDIYFANVGYFENETFGHNVQSDMTELIAKHKIDLNRFDASTISGVQAAGSGIYALPVFTDTMGLYYNKDLFDKFGVAYPKNGMVWDELNELSRKLTRNEGGRNYLGYAPFPNYTLFMNPLSIPLVDAKTLTPTINRDAKWNKFFQTLVVAPSEVPGARDYLNAMKTNVLDGFYEAQDVAMLVNVSFSANNRPGLSKFDWDWVSVPTFPDQRGVGMQPYTQYFGLTRMAKQKDAAMELLKHLVSDEFQAAAARRGFMPVLKNADIRKEFGKETVYKDKNWAAYFYHKMAEVPYKGLYEIPVSNIYASHMSQVMAGKLDVNTALRLAEEGATKTLQELRAK